jgi:hypothetical protein
MESKGNSTTYRLSHSNNSVKKADIFSVFSKLAVKDIIAQGLPNYKLNHRLENTTLIQNCFRDYDLATILDLPGYQDVFRDYSDGVKYCTYYIPKEHGSYTVVPCAMYMDSLDTLFTNESYLLYTTHPWLASKKYSKFKNRKLFRDYLLKQLGHLPTRSQEPDIIQRVRTAIPLILNRAEILNKNMHSRDKP